MRWRVQRAGVPGRYWLGWFALTDSDGGQGAWFPTHAEAVNYAHRMATAAAGEAELTASLAAWGIERKRRRRGVSNHAHV